MSLLQNEEFVLYQLRTSYLTHIKDGVGDRLITVNSAVLNDPAFRAAGWAPNASDIKRTYSPPIPTAITSEYFQAPRSAGLPRASFGEDEEEGGMVTGIGSGDTVGPDMKTRRKRRKELLEEDDSSDLSDESEDNDDTQRPVQQIKFTKMPLRTRAGSSPLRNTNLTDEPAILVTSPSRPGESHALRRGSFGATEVFKGRPRKDTTTSSEFSSENELDPSYFQRKQINPRRAARASHLLSERIQEDEREHDMHDVDPLVESESDMSSEFEGSEDTASILDDVGPMTSLTMKLPGVPAISTSQNSSPKKGKLPQPPAVLQALPPPRPISIIAPPVSALTRALKAKNKAPGSPFDRFATLSGKGDPNPLYIKIFVPFSKPPKTYELLLKRHADGGAAVTVAEAIGLALYRYGQEKLEPPIQGEKLNVNRYNFRMVEDQEIDDDFPALTRTQPITEFTSNNNRPPQRRARDKPWDEFGMVEASEAEFAANERSTPLYSKQAEEVASNSQDTAPTPKNTLAAPTQLTAPSISTTPTPSYMTTRNPITGPSFSSATASVMTARPAFTPADLPMTGAPMSTPRTGAPKTMTIHFTDENFVTRTTLIEVTTDTYIAEVFDQACKRLGVDKALYVLKVSSSTTVAPSDRTVEALGDRGDLDLVRRRFVTDGDVGRYGSPGSSSPNAPLLISQTGIKKGKKGITTTLGIQAKTDALASLAANAGQYKRYHITRKQPMSFSSSSARILALDGEYMHIMPTSAEHHPADKLFDAPGKVTTVHFSSVIGTKVSRRHPRTFRVVVYKEKETKRYDFEAGSAEEAREIVGEVKRGVERVVGVV